MPVKINPKVSVCVVFVAAMFMSIMDTTIVNVALPDLGRQFGVASTSIDAVVVGYLISLAVIIPVSGWLGDQWGTRRVFLMALGLFSLASALCGLAQNLPMLIGFRVLQGIAGGAMTPVGTTILYRTFPPEERVGVSRILNIPTVIAPASGPVIGGFLVQQLSWRWVFYVNVPIGVAALLFGLLFLQEQPREKSAGRFDPLGFVLAGSGLGLLMYALSEGPTYGWTTPGIYGSALVGLFLVALFIVVELRAQEPMLDLRLLRNRLFCICNLVTMVSGAAFLGVLFVAPLFLQEARGASPLISGLTTFPEAIGVVVATQIVARMYPRIGPRRLTTFGLLGVSVMMFLLGALALTSDLWVMRSLIFLVGAGMAFCFTSVQAAGFATITPAETGRASALNNVQRQIGSAMGVAILSTVIGLVGPVTAGPHGGLQPNLTAYHVAFIVAALLALTSAIIALFISDRDAAPSMKLRKSREEQAAQAEILLEVSK
ncbi:MAG TPA: MDR family MFS transporter [Ktedonobacteraceae bacterium]|nr:MDR family MFS transporter [Ktedonobacteraceae bacterium]